MEKFYYHIIRNALRIFTMFACVLFLAPKASAQDTDYSAFEIELLNSVARSRYSLIENNGKVGIYDSRLDKCLTPVDMDYLEFSTASINSNGDTINSYLYEKGLQYGYVKINLTDNSIVITSRENPRMVARLDSCTTIDKQMNDKMHSILKNSLAAAHATNGQIAVIDAVTGSLRSWVAIGKKDDDYKDTLLLKRTCTPQVLVPTMLTAALQKAGLNLDDSVETSNGVLVLNDSTIVRDDSIIGTTSWQEAIECHSNIALFKLMKEINGEEDAIDFYKSINRKKQTSNAMDIAAILNSLCNKGRIIVPTLKGAYVEEGKVADMPEQLNKMEREFIMQASRRCETLPDYTHRGMGAAGLYYSVKPKDNDGKEIMEYETSFAGLYPMFEPKYAIAFFMDTPQKVILPEDKNLAVIDSIIDWLYEYRLVNERLDIANRIIDNMVHIEGGTLTMVIQNDESKNSRVKGKQVHVGNFKIGKYEVTQREWEAVMGTVWSMYRSPEHPVEDVNWDDCQKFIKRLNEMTGMKFRLPTEAEWHFAAYGGNKTHGYKYAGGNDIDSVAWYGGNNNWETHDVGLKAPNELGLYDMTGNVSEWCQDYYNVKTHSTQLHPTKDPIYEYHIISGSSFDNAENSVLTRRDYDTKGTIGNTIGLRLAMSE